MSRYREIVESQVEMVCRFRLDGTILFVNQAYARARDSTVDALTGANFWSFIPEHDHPSVRAMLDGITPEAPEVLIENRFTTAGGVRWTLWSNRALSFDSDGRPLELQSSGLDITDRKIADEALRESERRYRHVFESAAVSIWETDFSAVKRAIDALRQQGVSDWPAYFAAHPDWVASTLAAVRIRKVNPATLRMFGAASDTELLEALDTIFLPETQQVFVDKLLAVAEGRAQLSAETVLRALDGRTLHVLFSMTFPSGDEPFDSVLVTLTDITSRKTAEMQLAAREAHYRQTSEALQRTNRIKDEFLATLSHELRTPLNAVIGWTHMLRSGALSPEMSARALDALERNARSQTQLIDDLLDMSRIVSGRLQIASAPIDLATVLAGALDTVRPAAASKAVDLQVALDATDARYVTGDADRLRQILWNVLSNAIKFTPARGVVAVTLRGTPEHAEFEVRDTGEGIEPEFLPYVFDRFRQADATSTRRHGGLGLGLSIARHLAEAHGGTLVAESAGPGQGATFTLRLPRDGAAPTPRPDTATPRGEPRLAGLSVLVVDDEADARELFRVALEFAGAEAIVAESAAAALAALAAHRVDLILADLGMPDQDGLAFIRSVRALPAPLGRLPAIAVTAYTPVGGRDASLAAGFDAHLAKPIEIEQLLDAAERILAASRTRPSVVQ